MAMGYSTALRNAQMDAKTTLVGAAGKFAIYDGARPATGGAVTNKLAEFTTGTPFAPAAVGGVLSATLPAGVLGLLGGTATWARLVTSAGTFVADYAVTATGGGGDVQLNTTTVSVGVNVSVTAWTETAGNL